MAQGYIGKILVLTLLVLALGACASKQNVNYYTLSYFSEANFQGHPDQQRKQVSVFIAYLPNYLEKNQIALRSPNSVNVRYDNYELWAEPLRQSFARVLVESLNQRLMPDYGAIMYRSGQSEYRLNVEIAKFSGDLNNTAELELTWQLSAKNTVVKGSFKQSLPVGASMESLVDSQSRLVIAFAESLSLELKNYLANEEKI